MMQNKKSLSSSDDVSDINISPLIDMVFILLIFFIVTTVFVKEPGVDVARPFAYNALDIQKNCILVAVTANNEVFYGGENVGLHGIRTIIRRAMQENDRMPVVIQADVAAQAGVVARLVDECKLGNAPAGNIHLSMEKVD